MSRKALLVGLRLRIPGDGSAYRLSLSIRPIHDDAGRLVRFASVQTNVTRVTMRAVEQATRLAMIPSTSRPDTPDHPRESVHG